MMTKKRKAMTLIEVIVVIIILGILATMGVVNYWKTIVRAKQKDAKIELMLIQQAEEVRHTELNNYTTCADTAACNTALRLNLQSSDWTYSVPNADATTFCAQAAGGTELGNFHIHQTDTAVSSGGC